MTMNDWPYGKGVLPLPLPWECAQAIEEFVRAVHLSVRWERSRARLWHSKRAERDELKGALVGIRESLDALNGGTERPPAPRTTCYFCNGPVVDSRCTRCEARQP